ncbi:MAG: iron-containing alcohol dehydrogenase [Candidatus Limiplasma sp.]|nr:iron-containing alcohol dehydrogenase [Candidatus Limiplasma sp.]
MRQVLMQGAARYVRAEDALDHLEALCAFGQKPLVVHGETALKATEDRLLPGLERCGIRPHLWRNDGFCSRSQVARAVKDGRAQGCDFVLALGGGKCMDLGKAIAAALGLPIVTIPTVAATCAAVTPFSVMYDEEGRPDGAIYHDVPVDLCMADTAVLCAAPERALRAGMVDSLAKLPELCCGEDPSAPAPFLLGTARLLARHVTGTLTPACARLAQGEAIPLEETLDAVIALTGTCSGYAAGTKQLAIAHAFNGAVRFLHPQKANGWLHGETVGVGILVQMRFNGDPGDGDFKGLLGSLGMPDSLCALGMKPEGVAEYIADHMGFAPGSPQSQKVAEAVGAHL